MQYDEKDLIITDVETTGWDPAIHEVLEIGAARVDQKSLEVICTFETKIIPHRLDVAQPKALEVNGYTPERWKHAVESVDAWESYIDWARKGVFASWSSFDWGFAQPAIRQVYRGSGDLRFGPFDRHLLDLSSAAWGALWPVANLSKDAVAVSLGLPTEPLPHSGLTGALHALSIVQEWRRRARRVYGQEAA